MYYLILPIIKIFAPPSQNYSIAPLLLYILNKVCRTEGQSWSSEGFGRLQKCIVISINLLRFLRSSSAGSSEKASFMTLDTRFLSFLEISGFTSFSTSCPCSFRNLKEETYEQFYFSSDCPLSIWFYWYYYKINVFLK